MLSSVSPYLFTVPTALLQRRTFPRSFPGGKRWGSWLMNRSSMFLETVSSPSPRIRCGSSRATTSAFMPAWAPAPRAEGYDRRLGDLAVSWAETAGEQDTVFVSVYTVWDSFSQIPNLDLFREADLVEAGRRYRPPAPPGAPPHLG